MDSPRRESSRTSRSDLGGKNASTAARTLVRVVSPGQVACWAQSAANTPISSRETVPAGPGSTFSNPLTRAGCSRRPQ
ncbi:hypothetical protein ACF08M_16645 [Streptomyces sp. NPDC015032]|uniref:hypothetical protein n=1 Tax=Streptomyces sp. NPDC015032 TaxID=3364937 RepID=UPI003700C9A4